MTWDLRSRHTLAYLTSIGVAMLLGCAEQSATAPADENRMSVAALSDRAATVERRSTALVDEIAMLLAEPRTRRYVVAWPSASGQFTRNH